MMNHLTPQQVAWSGRHVSVVTRGNWEYVTRHTSQPAVGIVAVTDRQEVILVEQYRPPVDQAVVELPAGLAGDIAGSEDESLLTAAQRELLEETGYTAAKWTELFQAFSSPGLTDESMVIFLAEGLTRKGPGGGDASESIVIHTVPITEVPQWLVTNQRIADLKLWAGLAAAQRIMQKE